MPDQSVVLDQVRRLWEYAGADVDRAHELYQDDAVLEFPQSGERFERVTNFTEWRRRYPAEVRYRVRRITAREDLVVVEVSASYNGGPWQFGVQLLEFRGDRVARRADLRHGGLGGPRVASPLAVGHSCRPAGYKRRKAGRPRLTSASVAGSVGPPSLASSSPRVGMAASLGSG
ncbi:MAG TPA: nuclear transport factor 2 family protein [Actinomycetota bacterium]|jgi:SnoaL-like domain